MPYLGIFGKKLKKILNINNVIKTNWICRYNVEKDIAIFVISAFKVERFTQNVRNFNLGQKVPSLD